MNKIENIFNLKGVDLTLYNQAYRFVIANGGSVAEAHFAGIKKVKNRYKVRNEILGFTF